MADEIIYETKEDFHQILDALQDMVLLKGPHSKILWANKAFCDFYDMTNEQLYGILDTEVNEPGFTQQYILDDKKVFDSGRVLDIPIEPVTRFDGEVRYFHTIKSPIKNKDGNVIMTVGVSRDITDQHLAQKAFEKKQEELENKHLEMNDKHCELITQKTQTQTERDEKNNLQNILDSLKELAIISTDIKGIIQYFNQSAIEFFGDILKKNNQIQDITSLLLSDHFDSDKIEKMFNDILQHKKIKIPPATIPIANSSLTFSITMYLRLHENNDLGCVFVFEPLHSDR